MLLAQVIIDTRGGSPIIYCAPYKPLLFTRQADMEMLYTQKGRNKPMGKTFE